MRHNSVVAEAAAKADIREMQEHYPHPWMAVALTTGHLEEGLPYEIFGQPHWYGTYMRGYGEVLSFDEIIKLSKQREAAENAEVDGSFRLRLYEI